MFPPSQTKTSNIDCILMLYLISKHMNTKVISITLDHLLRYELSNPVKMERLEVDPSVEAVRPFVIGKLMSFA